MVHWVGNNMLSDLSSEAYKVTAQPVEADMPNDAVCCTNPQMKPTQPGAKCQRIDLRATSVMSWLGCSGALILKKTPLSPRGHDGFHPGR